MKFEQWVKKQNDDFFNAAGLQDNRHVMLAYAEGIATGRYTGICAGVISDCNYRVSTYIKGKKVVTQIINMRKPKRGIAICNENDTFDPEIGIAYAWARYKKEAIPSFTITKKLSEMKNGDVFIIGDEKYTFVGKHPVSRAMQQCYAICDQWGKLGIMWEQKKRPIEFEVIT